MDIKKYKKEQEKKTPYQKISTALSASIHQVKRPHDIKQRLAGIKSHKAKMAAKMAKDQVDLDLHNEDRGYGKRAKY